LTEPFVIDWVALPDGRRPARSFIAGLDAAAAAKVDALIDRLRVFGTEMPGKFVTKLTETIFELRVKHRDRIFRVLFFYQPGRLIVLTSGFQKQTEKTPTAEITRAEELRSLWLKYHNNYPKSANERAKILRGAGV
jgi:phage-related protein